MKENPHMQSWAKRGLQTALVTGGLLMLGTGIASANERVNPDLPASPLDLNVTVPVQIADNALGTPFGQVNLPGHTGELSTKPVTNALKGGAGSLQSPAGAAANSAARQAPEVSNRGLTPTADPFKGNKASGDLIVPIQITGNALGIVGDAVVTDSNRTQTYSHNQDVATDGTNSGLAGNAIVLDWALPIQISGNAGGLLGGSGKTSGTATQSTTETGNITTDGTGSGLSGNVVGGQFATPVQVTGNAASWILGNAYSRFNADSTTTSGGYIKTAGDGGAGTGNVAGVPIALPVKFNGNAAGLWGSDADAVSNSSADATAGDKVPGFHNVPSYIQTTGSQSFLAGNVLAPQGGALANIAGNAGSWIGNSTTGNALGSGVAGTSSSAVDSGGFVSTNAQRSAGSGNIVDPAVAFPLEAFGIGGAYIGNSHANHDNTTTVNSGNGSFTDGTGAFLSGNTANTQSAATTEAFGIGGSHFGNASGKSTETKTVTAGGYDGTIGDNSSGSGNQILVPASVPVEVFGVGGSFIGQGGGAATETKNEAGGGGGSTNDDNGVVSSNLATAPISLPVQAFGIGGALIGQGHGTATSNTTSTAGSDVHATGPAGAVAGNLLQAPTSLPLQAHGLGGALLGIGTGTSDNLTDSKAGGNATTDGHNGALTGNIVQAPVSGAGTIFGDGGVLGGLGRGTGTNDAISTAGGDSTTNGAGGAMAGNILSAQGLPIAQIFGNAVAAPGIAGGNGTNNTTAQSGGDVTTSGLDGAMSGNILDVPASAVGNNQTTGMVGGVATTAGDHPNLSGFNVQHPVGSRVQIYKVARGLFGGIATATATNNTTIVPEPQINMPFDGSALPANQLPSLPALPGVGGLPSLPALPGAGSLPSLPALPAVSALPVQLPTGSTLPAQLPTLPAAPALPALNGVHAPQVQVPALAQMDSSPLGVFSGMLDALTGKTFHTQ
jgi:hypothetical protein